MANELQTAQVLREIAGERDRQIHGEGFSREHDDAHVPGALARAAAYAYWGAMLATAMKPLRSYLRFLWPWHVDLFKPKTCARRALVVAAAFIVAEIERHDRAKKAKKEEKT